jgi:sporulation protein YlmC with PRC-barrel domain
MSRTLSSNLGSLESLNYMYTTLRDYRFDRNIDHVRGSAVYGSGDEKIGKIADIVFDSNNREIRYLVIDTGGWLRTRRLLLPPEELRPSVEHENDFSVNLTKAQIEHDGALERAPLF